MKKKKKGNFLADPLWLKKFTIRDYFIPSLQLEILHIKMLLLYYKGGDINIINPVNLIKKLLLNFTIL